MIIFLKNGTNYQTTQAVKNRYDEIRSFSPKDKETAIITIQGNDYKLQDIKFIGYWCHNKGGSVDCQAASKWNIKAHPIGEVCPYDCMGACQECGKKLWERDRDYAVAKWGKMFCRAHSPFGKAEEALGVAGQNDSFTSTMIGMVSAYIEKGKTVEEALDSMQDKINKLKWKKKQTN